jgi:ABC-type glycerol-3-phosphate transport system permease component
LYRSAGGGVTLRCDTPGLVAFFLFSFVHHGNDYFWPVVMTTDDAVRTLPLLSRRRRCSAQ